METTNLELCAVVPTKRQLCYAMPKEWRNASVRIFAMYFTTEAEKCDINAFHFKTNNVDIYLDGYFSDEMNDTAAVTTLVNHILSSSSYVVDCRGDIVSYLFYLTSECEVTWTVIWGISAVEYPSSSVVVQTLHLSGLMEMNLMNMNLDYDVILVELWNDIDGHFQFYRGNFEVDESTQYEVLNARTLKICKENVSEDVAFFRLAVSIRRVITIALSKP